MKKICFLSSSGGHYEELMVLFNSLDLDNNNFFIVTEKVEFKNMFEEKSYFLKQINRLEPLFLPKIILNIIKSIVIYIRERPNIVICTGALASIPFCLISKLFRTKVIYIESFAKVYTGSLTGRFLYYFVDEFYVQWETLLGVYPKAKFKGSIY